MSEPTFSITVECPYCGEKHGIQLNCAIAWADVLNWVLLLSTTHQNRQTPITLVPDDVPKEEWLWLQHGEETWLFKTIAGYRRMGATYLLVRRIPIQPAGWDGRTWDGILKLTMGKHAEIVSEDNSMFLPFDQWEEFLRLEEKMEFRLGGKVWKKLSTQVLRRISQNGTLTTAPPASHS